MKTIAALLTGVFLCTACGESPPAEVPTPANKEELLQTLFEAQDKASLQATIAEARKAGISEQAILEARFVALVDEGDNAAIGKLAADLEKAAKNFRTEDSAIFAAKEEFLAVLEYARALAALETGDHEGFERHIKEAFWLSPNQGPAFAPHIERLRLDQAMAQLQFNFERNVILQESGKSVSLAEARGEASHVLLHFWSPWSEECAAFLEDFIATSNELTENGIAVISILAETSPEALPDAKSFVADTENKPACTWILDDPKDPLSTELRLTNLPTFVLIHKDGRVLFNGHPAEEGLWNQLKQAVPTIERPAVDPSPEATQP
jgi:peroxiredoxin